VAGGVDQQGELLVGDLGEAAAAGQGDLGLPPLTVSAGEIDEALAILEAALTAVEAGHPAARSEAH
jgi:hypothetical protein